MLLLVKETSKLELHNYLGTDFLMLFALHLDMGGGEPSVYFSVRGEHTQAQTSQSHSVQE